MLHSVHVVNSTATLYKLWSLWYDFDVHYSNLLLSLYYYGVLHDY